jgi:hypothetical protein
MNTLLEEGLMVLAKDIHCSLTPTCHLFNLSSGDKVAFDELRFCYVHLQELKKTNGGGWSQLESDGSQRKRETERGWVGGKETDGVGWSLESLDFAWD